MDSGFDFVAVLVGGGVLTFAAVAILEMVKTGRARRAQESIERERRAELIRGEGPSPSSPPPALTATRREDPSGESRRI
jgi:hypothetical protein